MEIGKLNDFYIDLDGDIKASLTDTRAAFITETTKHYSEYIIAQNLNEIINKVNNLNNSINIDIKVLKQYSVKRDKDDVLKSIKIFIDHAEPLSDGAEIILKGLEFINGETLIDSYFLATREAVENIINKNNINYKIMEYDTHEPVLYAITNKSNSGELVNFKTYYVKKGAAPLYNKDFIDHLKAVLTF
jgi:hypothetical protein